jgi:hypothetical protein
MLHIGNTLEGYARKGPPFHIPLVFALSAQISDRTRRAAEQKTSQFFLKNWLEPLIILDSLF